jgi:DtxR family Mn-dependent transcriptional regulator
VDKLAFRWDEVHELAEQLEHVQSEALIERLDKFLGLPKFDPHGDPIPNKHGKIIQNNHISLSNAAIGKKLVISGVLEHSDQFLSHLNHTNLVLGQKIVIKSVNDFDQSMQVSIHKKEAFFISHQVAKNILVTCQ